jgi:hypothetical protein
MAACINRRLSFCYLFVISFYCFFTYCILSYLEGLLSNKRLRYEEDISFFGHCYCISKH